MATHSSILAWRMPGIEEPGGLQSSGSQRVGHDCSTKHTCEAACSVLNAVTQVLLFATAVALHHAGQGLYVYFLFCHIIY